MTTTLKRIKGRSWSDNVRGTLPATYIVENNGKKIADVYSIGSRWAVKTDTALKRFDSFKLAKAYALTL